MHNKCWYPQEAPVFFLPIQAALLCSRWVMREFQRKHESEHYMMITEWEWDVESTYQMCAPAGSACACVCAVWGLSSCQSGTCAGPPRPKRCRPRMQLEVKRKTSIITTNSWITNTIIPGNHKFVKGKRLVCVFVRSLWFKWLCLKCFHNLYQILGLASQPFSIFQVRVISEIVPVYSRVLPSGCKAAMPFGQRVR